MGALNLRDMFGGINWSDWLTSFESGYTRRFAEKYYDKIAAMPFFLELKKKPAMAKYLMEAVNNATFAFFDQKIDGTSPLRKLIKETIMDASSELNKRLINGTSVKDILLDNADKIESPQEKNFLAVLLMMDEKNLGPFLESLLLMTEAERIASLNIIKGMTPETLSRFAGLPEEIRSMVIGMVQEPSKKPKRRGFLDGVMDVAKERMKKSIEGGKDVRTGKE